MQKISVFIITYNEEQNIRECLESVAWADEIVIVDAFSRDRTVEICEKYTQLIFQEEWKGFGPQKASAFAKTTGDWVLNLDADERVTPALQKEIQQILTIRSEYDGYYIPMQNYFLGRPIRHGGWYPSYHLRLFRRDARSIEFHPAHGGVTLNGNLGYLTGELVHYTHPTIRDSLVRMNLNSSIEAISRLERKKVRWHHLFLHPVTTFLSRYFIKLGFLDGMPGLLLALTTSMTKLAIYMKVWEAQNVGEARLNLKKDLFRIRELEF